MYPLVFSLRRVSATQWGILVVINQWPSSLVPSRLKRSWNFAASFSQWFFAVLCMTDITFSERYQISRQIAITSIIRTRWRWSGVLSPSAFFVTARRDNITAGKSKEYIISVKMVRHQGRRVNAGRCTDTNTINCSYMRASQKNLDGVMILTSQSLFPLKQRIDRDLARWKNCYKPIPIRPQFRREEYYLEIFFRRWGLFE